MNLKRILSFFNLTTVTEAQMQYLDGINQERNRQSDTRDKIELDALRSLMGKAVIGISNEWENPLIGTMVDVDFITKAMRPVPVVHNVLTGETHITFAKIMPFTMQRFVAIMKLTPYERWCLIDDQLPVDYRDNDPRKLPSLLTYDEIMVKLVDAEFTGFTGMKDFIDPNCAVSE